MRRRKDDRLTMLIAPEDKDMLRRAAEIDKRAVSDFARLAALKAAARIISESKREAA